MLDAATIEIADRWWARDFACHPGELRPTSTRVQEHAGAMVGSTGIWILAVGPQPLVSMPKEALDTLEERACNWTRTLVADTSALSVELRPLPIERIVGPACIGYGTSKTLDLSIGLRAHRLTQADYPGVARLQAMCSGEAWEHGGSDPHAVPTFGCVNKHGDVLALAGYKVWGGAIAHISIVSAPREQGRGHATAAVACAAQHALSAGLVPQYRTLASNVPSMAVAKKLGFKPYGFSVFVRLKGS